MLEDNAQHCLMEKNHAMPRGSLFFFSPWQFALEQEFLPRFLTGPKYTCEGAKKNSLGRIVQLCSGAGCRRWRWRSYFGGEKVRLPPSSSPPEQHPKKKLSPPQQPRVSGSLSSRDF